jgi:hypothetical protein
MSEGTLFNPGFLGESFNWWIGQIADDSTWRDNIVPGKYANKNDTPGWGRRYKVRIIGLHDQGEETIASDQLPWAQVMYPVTAGGGQTNSAQTPNLRQGNFVFGFFLDGQEQQVPVIMGVLGNNAQTELERKTGFSGGKNFTPQSGYANSKDPKTGTAKEKAPDEGLVTVQGKTPTKENPDAVHQTSAGDVKREDKLQEKIPLLKPDDTVGSAMKAIQTVLDNVIQKINKYLNAITSYVDRVSNTISDLQKLISDAACVIAKYMKIIFDKIMEYVLKLLNKTLTKVVSAIPSSFRYMFGDMKEVITELILCLYNKITQNLCGLMQGMLDKIFKPKELQKRGSEPNVSSCSSVPKVPMCSAEDIVGRAISYNKTQIDDANNAILKNVNAFLEDIQNQIAGVSGSLSDITSLVGNISGSLTSALSFSNLTLNVFGCELKPNVAVSDFYTFARGGAAAPDSQQPSNKSIDESAAKPADASPSSETPYVEPSKATKDLDIGESNAETRAAAAQERDLQIF